MIARLALPSITLISVVFLQACTPLFVAGGATAAVAAHDRRTVGSFIDDENIELKTLAAIKADKEVYELTHINVTSLNGVVLLTGESPTTELRDRVLSAARTVTGVRRIVNEIRIAPPTSLASRSTDAWLTTKVKSQLVSNEKVSAGHVKVVTEYGVVYLMGLLRKDEADAATETTRQVGGVQRVVKLFEYVD